ncbi:MAG TPA: hypothetical protein VEJ18_00710 [Planctomycetota bacterium]|nr:hypothetical protein [Planctomycetota bacterium]
MTLEDMRDAIEKLRLSALFGSADPAGKGEGGPVDAAEGALDCLAESEFLSALAMLEAARHHAERARIHQARALAASPCR